jgi:hypothetical protein
MQGKMVSIYFGLLQGECSGGTVLVRSYGNMPEAEGVTSVPVHIINNGTNEVGIARPLEGYMTVATSASEYLSAGQGGLFYAAITYMRNW